MQVTNRSAAGRLKRKVSLLKEASMAWFVDEKATPMYQLLEAAFLIAVVACLVYATARVRKGPSELLLQRIGFLIAVSACILLAAVFRVLEFQWMVVHLF